MKIKLVHVLVFACGSIPKEQFRIFQKDMENFIPKERSMAGAVEKTWDFLHGTRVWILQSPVELQESHIMKSLVKDIEVLCIMQWGLLWYSPPSQLNEILMSGFSNLR